MSEQPTPTTTPAPETPHEAEHTEGVKSLTKGAQQRLPQAYAIVGYLMQRNIIPVPDETSEGKAGFDLALWSVAEILSVMDWIR